MSYELQKWYIERNFDNFVKDLNSTDSEDLLFTYFTLWCLFSELDQYNIDKDIITDGWEDKQIDWVYLVPERNEINIIQVKKSNSNFSSNIIIQISNWLDWFLNQPKDKVQKLNNIKLREKILEVREDTSWFKMDSSMVINVYYCNLANSADLWKEVIDEVNKINSEYKSVWPKFNFKIIWVQEYYNYLKNTEKEDINCEIEITDKNAKLEYDIDENTKWIVVTTSTKQIAELVKQYKDKLFEQNIRYSLWLKNKVNQKIRETATTDKSQFFWYFNNGITIVCNNFSVVNNPNKNVVNLKWLQIVNWCQTSTTLYDAYDRSELKDSYVIVKIFSSKDQNFINTITAATNSQSAINSRDLLANDPLQDLIRENLYPKYFYEHKRNQYKWLRIQENKKINNEKLWQAAMSIILKQPSKARSNKNAIFSQTTDDNIYKKIFNRSVEQLLLCYLIFSYCEKMRNNTILDETTKSQVITYWTFHISRIIWQLLFSNWAISSKKDELDKMVEKIENDPDYLKSYFRRFFARLSSEQ